MQKGPQILWSGQNWMPGSPRLAGNARSATGRPLTIFVGEPIIVAANLQRHISTLIPGCQFTKLDNSKILYCVNKHSTRKGHVFCFGVRKTWRARANSNIIMKAFTSSWYFVPQVLDYVVNFIVYEYIVRYWDEN